MKSLSRYCLLAIIILLFNTLFGQNIIKEDITVLSFTGWQGQGDYYTRSLTDKINTLIIQTYRFNVIDRENLEAILHEQYLQLTGFIDESTAITAGRLVGVDKFIVGAITRNSTEFHEAKYSKEGKKNKRKCQALKDLGIIT